MKHLERIELAEHILKKLKKKHGNKILVGAVYGSVAKNTDSEKSDLDILIISKKESKFIEDKFMVKNIPVSYWSKNIDDIENVIKYPSFDDWPWALNTFLNFKTIIGDNKIQKKLKDHYKKLSLQKCHKAVGNHLPEIYEWNIKIQKSYSKNDNGNLIFGIWDNMNAIVGCIALLNKKYFIGNGYDRFKESFKFKVKPKNYKKLVETAYISKNPKKAYMAYMELFDNFETLVKDKGIKIKIYDKKGQIRTYRHYLIFKSFTAFQKLSCFFSIITIILSKYMHGKTIIAKNKLIPTPNDETINPS